MSIQILADLEASQTFAAYLASLIKIYFLDHPESNLCIYLKGDLGAGKTTLAREIIHKLGYKGAVKSPTYSIVESYVTGNLDIFHFDLYRIQEPEELEIVGIREYFSSSSLCLIEWPCKGKNIIKQSDLEINLDFTDEGRTLIFKVLNESIKKYFI